MFGKIHQQPYVQHRLKMLLGTKLRKDIHGNLRECDLACWTDYSKEFESKDQEQCKSSAFGASNVTIQIVGQVYEMLVLKPSPPRELRFDQASQDLHFVSPEFDGGSRIQMYEVHIKKSDSIDDHWQMFRKLEVAKFSSAPIIPPDIFGRLGGSTSGSK